MSDVTLEDTVYIEFSTRAFATGIPTTLAGTPVVSWSENGGVNSAAGVTLTVDLNTVAGNHLLTIAATAANGFESGKHYNLKITTGTVAGVSVVGEVVARFTISASAAATDLANATDGLGALKAILDTSGVVLTATATSAQLVDDVWDEVLTGATHNVASSSGRRLRSIQEFQGYEGGAVWIDTVNGNAGTVSYENGTVENPVDTIADANTIASAVGLSRFRVAPGSSITFAATQANQSFIGHEWTLALGGQSIAGTRIEGAVVSGTGTGTGHHFIDCNIGNVSIEDGSMGWCMFTGTITLTGAGDSYWHDCYSGVAGSGTPVVDFGALVGNSNLNVRRYSGGLQIDNKDATGTDLMSLEGNGQLLVSASSSGAISLRGNFKVTNTGGATITYDDNSQGIQDIETDTAEIGTAGAGLTDLGGMSTAMKAEVNAECDTALTDYDGPTNAEMEARTPTAAELLYMTRHAATALPVTFTGGTTTTAVLGNVDGSAASSTDDVYNSRLLVFNAGTLDQQVCQITDYTGSTKTATISAVTTAVTSGHTAILV